MIAAKDETNEWINWHGEKVVIFEILDLQNKEAKDMGIFAVHLLQTTAIIRQPAPASWYSPLNAHSDSIIGCFRPWRYIHTLSAFTIMTESYNHVLTIRTGKFDSFRVRNADEMTGETKFYDDDDNFSMHPYQKS